MTGLLVTHITADNIQSEEFYQVRCCPMSEPCLSGVLAVCLHYGVWVLAVGMTCSVPVGEEVLGVTVCELPSGSVFTTVK